jgi:hypothetical protein
MFGVPLDKMPVCVIALIMLKCAPDFKNSDVRIAGSTV